MVATANAFRRQEIQILEEKVKKLEKEKSDSERL